MRRIVLAFVRVGRSVGLMLEALSLEARTRGKDRRRKLSAFLSLSLSLSLCLSPLLSSSPASWVSFFLSLIALYLSNNAPLCSATLEPCIFLDAMDFPKAFRCFASTLAVPSLLSGLGQRHRRALFPRLLLALRTFPTIPAESCGKCH